MTPEKVLEVIFRYRAMFEGLGVPKEKLPEDLVLFVFTQHDSEKIMLPHCHAMLDEMEQFVKSGRMEKCFRWLGFIQGVLWARGNFSLNELKNHNRPDNEATA